LAVFCKFSSAGSKLAGGNYGIEVTHQNGTVEFEYEGDAEFTHDSIKDLFTHMEALFSASTMLVAGGGDPKSPDALDAAGQSTGNGTLNLHTNSIAAKLGAKSGPEVALAAAAYLQMTESKDRSSRRELLTAMQSANAHYKDSMSGNLTKHIKTLLSSHQLNQLGQDAFSLSASARSSLEQRLA
jgi:hypothetical protein